VPPGRIKWETLLILHQRIDIVVWVRRPEGLALARQVFENTYRMDGFLPTPIFKCIHIIYLSYLRLSESLNVLVHTGHFIHCVQTSMFVYMQHTKLEFQHCGMKETSFLSWTPFDYSGCLQCYPQKAFQSGFSVWRKQKELYRGHKLGSPLTMLC
jgi:hypothetical protein